MRIVVGQLRAGVRCAEGLLDALAGDLVVARSHRQDSSARNPGTAIGGALFWAGYWFWAGYCDVASAAGRPAAVLAVLLGWVSGIWPGEIPIADCRLPTAFDGA
jgi:hypothetical protein